jgi:hypothetical protein
VVPHDVVQVAGETGALVEPRGMLLAFASLLAQLPCLALQGCVSISFNTRRRERTAFSSHLSGTRLPTFLKPP